MTDLDQARRFFAEEVQIASNIRSAALVDALATVPRERFLPPGPWTIRSEGDFGGPPRQTPGAEPHYVYHNVAVGIDLGRMLFNGAPGVIGMAIDALGLQPGGRVLHIGTGTGYFTALLAHCVGPAGKVIGIEVEESLAAAARRNLAGSPWAVVYDGDGSRAVGGPYDAILVNAGVTHPLDWWIAALAPGGRVVLPITATAPQFGTIGKGPLLALTATADPRTLDARTVTFVAIYSAVGIRDDAQNAAIGRALQKNPFAAVRRCRLDAHEESPGCWLHLPRCCFSTE